MPKGKGKKDRVLMKKLAAAAKRIVDEHNKVTGSNVAVKVRSK